MTVRAICFHEYGDPSVLRLEDVPRPTPAADEVLVRVQAAGVNPFDTYVRAGTVEPDGGLPHVGGSDMAGVVDSLGDRVSEFAAGDRVFATGLGLDRPGTFAEYVAVPAARLAHLPDEVSFEVGAAAETITTADAALVHRGGLAVGDVCLVQGASGGVGHAAIQIASHANAFVVGTARPGEPAAAVRSLGADAVVDYRADDLAAEIRVVTDGRPVDVVLETHADANIQADLRVLGADGRIVLLGEDDAITIPPGVAGAAKAKQAELHFLSHMRSIEHHAHLLERAGRWLADGTMRVEIAATYPLAEATAAQEHCLRGGVLGKVILDVRA